MTQVVDVRLTLEAARWLRDLVAQHGKVGGRLDVAAFQALVAAIDGAVGVASVQEVRVTGGGGGGPGRMEKGGGR